MKISDEEEEPNSPSLELFTDVDDDGRSFVLTAQGGLKGTSKPIVYTCLMNENLRYSNASGATPLTKDKLEIATYHMSFQYGTATKAVRSIPVIYYSKRLAEMGMGYINYLRGKKAGSLPNQHGDHGVITVPMEGNEENETEALEFIRSEMKNAGSGDLMKTELLPSFSPLKDGSGKDGWRAPFRPHLSA
uniref:Piwi domain-containing protein n=1 Tax=Trieres chinensis TaxID=1514140 RepID=A0A7S1ZRN1_TRICV